MFMNGFWENRPLDTQTAIKPHISDTPTQTVFLFHFESLSCFCISSHLLVVIFHRCLFHFFSFFFVSHCGYCECLWGCFASFWTLNKNTPLLFLFPFFLSRMWRAWADVVHFSHGLWMSRISEMEMTCDAFYSGEMNMGKMSGGHPCSIKICNICACLFSDNTFWNGLLLWPVQSTLVP